MTVDVERVQAIFLTAVEADDPARQAAILDAECGSDHELRRRVEALLHAHRNPPSVLERPAVAPVSTAESIRASPRDAGQTEALKPIDLGFLAPATRPGALGRLGHYDVLEILGRGGFGIVLRAVDDVLQRLVAVKVLTPDLAATSPARKRFLREARAYAKIRHENVVQVHAVEEQPLPFLVMEFVPGETLQQRIDRSGPLDVVEVVRVGRQIAEGLAAAHETGLIHRDVKPANVLIENGPQGRVKLTDFGLARAADDASISQSGLVVGTPLYMAPEQAKGEALDHRADLFSLGSVLYVMCTGRPPFRADGTMAILKRVCEDTPRPIPEIIPEAPSWLCDLIARLHDKDRTKRFQCARDVVDLLRVHEADLAAPGKVAEHSIRPKTWPRLALAGAVAILLIGALTFLAIRFSGSKDGLNGNDPKSGVESRIVPSKFAAVTNGIPGRLPHAGRTSWFAQDREQKWLAVPCENEVVLFDARTMTPVKVLRAAADRVYQVAFSPDGKRLATAIWSDEDSVIVWDMETGTPLVTLPHHGHCWSVQFSPDGNRLLTLGQDHVPTVWDAHSGANLRSFPHQVQPVCADATFSADGKKIVTHIRGGDLMVWDAQTWQEVKPLAGPQQVTVDEDDWLHFPVAVSADGKWLAAGSPAGFKVWETATWKEQVNVKETPATWLAFAADGRSILTGGHENPEEHRHSVARWETESGAPLKSAHLASRGTWAVYHLSHDGKTLYAMACDPAEPSIHLYDADTLVERFLPGMGSTKNDSR